jgi:hypothetical protein
MESYTIRIQTWFQTVGIMIFKLVIKHLRPNRPHQNKRKQSAIVNHSDIVPKHYQHMFLSF